MTKSKPISKKQLAVIEDIFEGELDEQVILQKNNLSRKQFEKWLADENFISRLDWRLSWEHRKSEFMLARYTRAAVSNLVKLTDCKTPETARKACMDILTMRSNPAVSTAATPNNNPAPALESPAFSPEAASKIITFMAKEKLLCTS